MNKYSITYKNVNSFNSQSNVFDVSGNVNLDIKTIVVGSLTPFEGREYGYFYASPRNCQISIIDGAMNTQIASLYSQLRNNPCNFSIINDIKNALTNVCLAFLDVIKEANSPDMPGCAADKLIKSITLDEASFEKVIKANPKINFICNSHFAEKCLRQILSAINVSFSGKVDYCPQISRKGKYATKQSKINQFQNCI